MGKKSESISGSEAYIAVKDHENTFYSIFFDADAYYPPTIVRLLIIGTYLSLFSLVGLILLSGIDYYLLDKSLLRLIPAEVIGRYTGLDGVLPIHVFGSVLVSLFLSIYVFSVLASKISLPYEENHIDWVEKIQPNRDVDDYYPPYEYWADKVIDEEYLRTESIPNTAPPELRELTRYERFRNWVGEQLGRVLSFVFLILTLQIATLTKHILENTGPFRNR